MSEDNILENDSLRELLNIEEYDIEKKYDINLAVIEIHQINISCIPFNYQCTLRDNKYSYTHFFINCINDTINKNDIIEIKSIKIINLCDDYGFKLIYIMNYKKSNLIKDIFNPPIKIFNLSRKLLSIDNPDYSEEIEEKDYDIIS